MAIGDQFPVVIPIPCEVEEDLCPSRKLEVDTFADEGWIPPDVDPAFTFYGLIPSADHPGGPKHGERAYTRSCRGFVKTLREFFITASPSKEFKPSRSYGAPSDYPGGS